MRRAAVIGPFRFPRPARPAVAALLACLVLSIGSGVALGQVSDRSTVYPTHRPPDEHSPWLRFDDPGQFDALYTWYPPAFIRAGVELKDFIRSDAFAAFRRYAGDARAVDAIYVRAMSLTANNTSLALLIAAVACFDHYVVGLDVPVLSLVFPLSNESAEEFAARVRNLPSKFYSDTPPGASGDRDKLQHFFGAAWIALTFESRGAAERVGAFVETGEEAVIVDGVLDSRDVRANWNGTEFGIALLSNNRRYPSEYFHTPIVEGVAGGQGAFGGPGDPDGIEAGCR
jgi:hypothetical protein